MQRALFWQLPMMFLICFFLYLRTDNGIIHKRIAEAISGRQVSSQSQVEFEVLSKVWLE